MLKPHLHTCRASVHFSRTDVDGAPRSRPCAGGSPSGGRRCSGGPEDGPSLLEAHVTLVAHTIVTHYRNGRYALSPCAAKVTVFTSTLAGGLPANVKGRSRPPLPPPSLSVRSRLGNRPRACVVGAACAFLPATYLLVAYVTTLPIEYSAILGHPNSERMSAGRRGRCPAAPSFLRPPGEHGMVTAWAGWALPRWRQGEGGRLRGQAGVWAAGRYAPSRIGLRLPHMGLTQEQPL